MLNSHGSWRGVSPNSAWIAGIAGPMMAMSSAPMSTPTKSTPSTRLRCLSSTSSSTYQPVGKESTPGRSVPSTAG